MKGMMPCSAKLSKLVVADHHCCWVLGFFPIKLQFVMNVTTQIFTAQEIRWRLICNAEEVGSMGSTAVRYLMQ